MIVVSHLIAFPFFSLILSALVSVCVTLVMLSLDYYVLSITGLESLKVFCGYTLKVALWFFFFACEFDSALLWVTVMPAEPLHSFEKETVSKGNVGDNHANNSLEMCPFYPI